VTLDQHEIPVAEVPGHEVVEGGGSDRRIEVEQHVASRAGEQDRTGSCCGMTG